jgi:aminoglycoside 2''-phosphotransferase
MFSREGRFGKTVGFPGPIGRTVYTSPMVEHLSPAETLTFENPNNVRQYLEGHFSDLHIVSIEALGEGTANIAFRVNDGLVFRFAKDKRASTRTEMEIHTLPTLQKSLSLRIPEIRYAGIQPNGLSFIGYREVPGMPLDRKTFEALSNGDKESMAEVLGKFLKEVHAFDLESLDVNRVSIVPYQDEYSRVTHEDVPQIETLLTKEEAEKLRSILMSFVEDEANFKFDRRLVHADLNFGNIVYDTSKRQISGIIDWGDMEFGDPAYDYSRLYESFGEEFAVEAMRHEGIEKVDQTMRKAKFYHLARNVRLFVRRTSRGDVEAAKRNLQIMKEELKKYQ